MRVLYFSRDYTTHDHRFLSVLGSSEHEAYYLRLQSDGTCYEPREIPEGVTQVEWAGGASPRRSVEDFLELMPHFSAVLRAVEPDVVHAGPVQSCGFLTALEGFRPFVLMSWGFDLLVDADRSDLWRWVTKYTLDRAQLLLCDSGETRAKALTFGFRDENVIQFPWGIDLEEFEDGTAAPELRARAGWKDALIVLSTRSWEGGYGIEVVLRAFERAHRCCPQLRLVLIGSGSLEPMVRRIIEEHKLHDLVFTPGRVSQHQISSFYAAADLYLSCSESDGTSVSLLEAMGSGLPVIVTERRSNAEWVQDEQNGWMAKVGDADAFANAILRAASLTSEERSRIGAANRQLIRERADWKRNAKLLLAAYERAAAMANKHMVVSESRA